eukprot:CAMPEP_0180795268 /NCGR_PEP_ID=MMETSP1038_2-20121128/56106_1 /TAXON_ID=632150 /ORGANISM="Azadinium spinosum, Strain 3D9" /LENGTH=97 /DNA_ID=CAMNT_0022834171 /DNA_START=115 /DNA_END=405 /DNA_ORIENTATION=+
MMDQMPTDRNCRQIIYVFNRGTRQWHKCCEKSLLTGSWQCIEATPSAWFAQRNKNGQPLPFDRTEAQECFRTKAPDWYNCESGYCTHGLEQCVVLND